MIWTMVSVILLSFKSYNVMYQRRCVILLPFMGYSVMYQRVCTSGSWTVCAVSFLYGLC